MTKGPVEVDVDEDDATTVTTRKCGGDDGDGEAMLAKTGAEDGSDQETDPNSALILN